MKSDSLSKHPTLLTSTPSHQNQVAAIHILVQLTSFLQTGALLPLLLVQLPESLWAGTSTTPGRVTTSSTASSEYAFMVILAAYLSDHHSER
jgi:hypothetical protein